MKRIRRRTVGSRKAAGISTVGYAAEPMAGVQGRLASVTALAGVVCVTCVGAASAHRSEGVGSARVQIAYGPVCKKQFGSTNCSFPLAAGVRVTVATWPGFKRLGVETTGSSGEVLFSKTLPFSLAFVFSGRVHGRLYQGGWRMGHLQGLTGQNLPLAILLCPSGAWIATLVSIASSCSERGTGVVAYGGPRGSA